MSTVPHDAELARELGEFTSQYARVNGVRLHYVSGGRRDAELLVLLPGWPHSWWSYRKMLPELARRHHVISVDLRGMGGSEMSTGGFDKRTMAADIHELISHLGHDRADVVGHDIGAMVAFSLAANHPDVVRRLALLDVFHPEPAFRDLPLLPGAGHAVNPGEEPAAPKHLWWFAFNQLDGLPERLLAGRMRELVSWLWEFLAINQRALTERDIAIYADRHDSPEAIRSGTGWYKTFDRDIADIERYQRLTVPTLGLPGVQQRQALTDSLSRHTTDPVVVPVPNSGHYVPDEQPEFVVSQLSGFFGADR